MIRRTPDPADGRIAGSVTKAAKERMPNAERHCSGATERRCGTSGAETAQLVGMLTRLIANLDRVASVEASPGSSASEKGRLIGP